MKRGEKALRDKYQPVQGITPEEKRALLDALDNDRPRIGLITSLLIHRIGLMMRAEKKG